MKSFRYWLAKLQGKILRNEKDILCRYFRKSGMKIGKNVNICCNIMTAEPYLIEIGNNVTISGDVLFVTHDNSICKIDSKCPNVFGYIKIGDNCFLGQRSTIMYGVELADNIIVAAGSVVTNSFSQERVVIAGNPAKVVTTWDKLYEKNKPFAMSRNEVKNEAICNPQRFIKRKSKD